MEEQIGYVVYNSKTNTYLTFDYMCRPMWLSLLRSEIYSDYELAEDVAKLYGCEVVMVNLSVVAKPLKD